MRPRVRLLDGSKGMDDRPRNLNFFGWIREGVKHSVLMGVSDAIEHLGAPPEAETTTPQVLAFLRGEGQQRIAATPVTEGVPAPARTRRRLGKSLKDLGGEQ